MEKIKQPSLRAFAIPVLMETTETPIYSMYSMYAINQHAPSTSKSTTPTTGVIKRVQSK